ncbi:MAG: TonB family protein [Dyadobacter sp.]|uniref:TonB family protein n=1 Tax=Dyadobacter sp. TaxID=1914288 RepID=UPI001B1B5788|nr:TonB family protein [Dyadobacter sp.]MBO9617130.1 TonB family protein [Dyadobacter sp.]
MLLRIPPPLLPKYISLALLAVAANWGTTASAHSISDSLDIRAAFLQTTRITGKITDESARPVANAAVLIAGSERGTVTNLTGGFEIADAPLNGTLIIQHPDFEPRQIPIVKSTTEYLIALKMRPQVLAMRMKGPSKLSRKDVETNQGNESGSSLRLDRWPYFRGLTKFLANNLKYPEEALQAGVQGPVQVSFLIDEDGNVSSGRIIKSPGIELDEEAMRLIRIMPKWTPAQKDGKPIAVWYTISIQFDPELDKLPLKVKEEVPRLFSRKMKLEPWKAPFLIKDEFEKLFRNRKVNLSAHEPPQTKLSVYGYGASPARLYVPLRPNFMIAP